MKENYQALMNAKELESITREWAKPIVKGTLIGFKGLSEENGITAAYPVWRVLGNEIQFVLYFIESSGRPCIDNTWFTSPNLFINKDPIIVCIEIKNPTTFNDKLEYFFNS